MGQSASKNTKNTIPTQTFTPTVEIVTKHQASQLGDVRLVKDTKTGQEMYVKKIVTQDVETYNTQLAYYYNRINNPHPSLVNVVGYTSEADSFYCSESYTIKLYVDALHQNMKKELENYTRRNIIFSEVELQLLCQNMVTILAHLQTQGIFHGDISPENIFYTDEAYKLCDPSFLGQKTANGAIRYLLLGVESLLAPELLKQVARQQYEITTNRFKADVFSLGATVLALATLTKSEDLYNFEKATLNTDLLEARIKKAETIYSPTFTTLLRQLLIIDEVHRPDFVELNEKLNISDVLRNYNRTHPVTSYAKVPYYKIAATLNGEHATPIVYPTHEEVLALTESKVSVATYAKKEEIHSPDNHSSAETGLTQSNFASPVRGGYEIHH